MIIFGTRGVTTTAEKGVFHCPACGPGSNFRWRRVRRFFTLYFIPVIPLDKLGEYIECGQCKRTYEPRVLDYNPASEALKLQGEFHKLLRHVMIATLPAPQREDRAMLVRLMESHEAAGHQGVDIGRWQRDAEELREPNASLLPQQLKAMSQSISDHGRETLLEAGYLATLCAGARDEMKLGELATALGLTPSHFQGLLKTLESNGRLPQPASTPPALPSTPPALP